MRARARARRPQCKLPGAAALSAAPGIECCALLAPVAAAVAQCICVGTRWQAFLIFLQDRTFQNNLQCLGVKAAGSAAHTSTPLPVFLTNRSDTFNTAEHPPRFAHVPQASTIFLFLLLLLPSPLPPFPMLLGVLYQIELLACRLFLRFQ